MLDKPSSGLWRVRETDVVSEGRALRLARDDDGRPCLLVPATGRRAETLIVTRGLKAQVRALVDAGAYEDWLILTSQDSGLDTTFFRLCDNVLRHLGAPDNESADPVAAALSIVERWRELMESLPSSLLSEGQCAGALAELHALELLVGRLGPQDAMTSWVGHDRARVDFRFSSCGIEVKATLHRDRFMVTIHGLLQMDPAGVGDLYLYAEQFERVPSGGDSIPQAISRLSAAGLQEIEVRSALSRVGYNSADEEIYAEMRFNVLSDRGVHVSDSTPRIVRSSFVQDSVADAVSSVSYSIDLTDLTVVHGRLLEAREVFERIAP
nr:PD-(D/E)XK motif protein [Terrabacter sp. MAHUQ-38]